MQGPRLSQLKATSAGSSDSLLTNGKNHPHQIEWPEWECSLHRENQREASGPSAVDNCLTKLSFEWKMTKIMQNYLQGKQFIHGNKVIIASIMPFLIVLRSNQANLASQFLCAIRQFL